MTKPIPPIRTQHIALEVADIDRSIEFYRSILGAKVTERHVASEVPTIPVALAFIRFGECHHDIVLAHNPQKDYRAATEADRAAGPAGIHHFGLEYADREAWLEQLDHVREAGFEVIRGPVVHSPFHPRGEGSWGENESFYVLDPDGHRIEFFCDMGSIGEDGQFIDAYGEPIVGGKAEEV